MLNAGVHGLSVKIKAQNSAAIVVMSTFPKVSNILFITTYIEMALIPMKWENLIAYYSENNTFIY